MPVIGQSGVSWSSTYMKTQGIFVDSMTTEWKLEEMKLGNCRAGRVILMASFQSI